MWFSYFLVTPSVSTLAPFPLSHATTLFMIVLNPNTQNKRKETCEEHTKKINVVKVDHATARPLFRKSVWQ
jgi:hypothetical protein